MHRRQQLHHIGGIIVVVEKRTPTYDLEAVKACISVPEKLEITRTALKSAQALGFQKKEIVRTVQSIARVHFYKSMTAIADSRNWQDVYYVPHDEVGTLYVKFTSGVVTAFMVLSFKEKEDI